MKRMFASLISAFSLFTANASIVGCAWVLADEPNNIKSIKD